MIRAGAWATATAAAVSVSWFGVHSVLADSAAVQPRPLAVGALGSPVASPTPPPPPAAIGAPAQTPSATRSATAAPTTAIRPHRTPGASPAPAATASPSERIVSYTRPGGIIVASVGATSAKLITATPDAGWSVQTWTSAADWFRVDFVKGATDTVFYMTWNGHAPMVQE